MTDRIILHDMNGTLEYTYSAFSEDLDEWSTDYAVTTADKEFVIANTAYKSIKHKELTAAIIEKYVNESLKLILNLERMKAFRIKRAVRK